MKKLLAAVLVPVLVLGALAGCSSASVFEEEEDTSIDCAIQVGSQAITEAEYRDAMINYKKLMLEEGVQDTVAYWEAASDEVPGISRSDFLLEQVSEQLILEKLYVQQFDELELSFSEKEQATFDAAQAELEDDVLVLVNLAKKSKVLNYYFGENGTVRPLDTQDIKDYYNVHHLCIKRILIDKVDAEGKPYSEEKLKELAARAEEAYQKATAVSKTDLFDSLIAEYSDDAKEGETENRMVYTAEEVSGIEMFDEAFRLEFGEVMQYELDEAYLILKRYDATADGVFAATDLVATMEEIRADELKELSDVWREEIEVKVNTEIVEKYRPELLG